MTATQPRHNTHILERKFMDTGYYGDGPFNVHQLRINKYIGRGFLLHAVIQAEDDIWHLHHRFVTLPEIPRLS
jgi:hypothetical protein